MLTLDAIIDKLHIVTGNNNKQNNILANKAS